MASAHSILSERGIDEIDKILSKGTTSVHVTALDGLVNVNSLFTVAVFVGLSLATHGQRSLEDSGACDAVKGHINNKLLRLGMLASALGSIMGCVFLMLSMVNVIQIRLGILSCGVSSTVRATLVLVGLVSTALAIYISTVIYAFTH